MVDFYREGGLNVFTFPVADPAYTMEALLDTPKLFNIGSVEFPRDTVLLGKTQADFDIFVLCGFPVAGTTQRMLPKLVKGRSGPGEVGAAYTYEFKAGSELKTRIKVQTELAEITDEKGFKRVVYKHTNRGKKVAFLGAETGVTSEFPLTNTESRFELTQDGPSWRMRFSFTGPNESMDAERSRGCNECGIFCMLVVCARSFVIKYEEIRHEGLMEHINRLEQYCNRGGTGQHTPQVYRAAVVVPGSGPKDAKELGVQEAIPLAQVSGEDARREEVEKWFEMYKNGAISREEYDMEKAKIMGQV